MLLNNLQINREWDPCTDEIYDIPNIYIVKAKNSRLVVDLSRAPNNNNDKGVIKNSVGNGKPIYKIPPTKKEKTERIKKYHTPFHAKIKKTLPKIKFIIDAHSLWSKAPATSKDHGKKRKDVCIGNLDYHSCSKSLTYKIADFFEKNKLSVSINKPFKGKYILHNYCSLKGPQGILLEFNRKLYMNEKTLHPNKKNIKKLNKIITALAEWLAEFYS